MKSIVLLILVIPVMMFAQVEDWIQHIIDDDFSLARSVYAIDLDSDEDYDVLGAAEGAFDIAWWQNDGDGNFTKHTIDNNCGAARSIFAIDLNGDTYVDVILGTSDLASDNVTWWENDGANPPSFTKHVIDANFTGAQSVFAIDMDGDDDIDILGASDFDDDITWWENDGAESFTKHIIDDNFGDANCVYAIDLDNDEDVDVLGTAFYDDDITWWENDGNQNFTEHTIKGNFDGARSVFAIDMDNDDDIDVLGTASIAQDITWWENDGANPPSFTEHIIAGSFSGSCFGYALDFDNDDDVDVLGAAFTTNSVAWWENDGSVLPNFTKHTIASFEGANCVFAADLNGDTNMDVLGAAAVGAAAAVDIAWWEKVFRDVGPISIDIPSEVPEDTSLYPMATIKNFGNQMGTFLVTCEIEPGSYLRNRTVSDLAPGDSLQITFFQEFAFENGPYIVKVYTRLDNDENSANDTLEKVIEVLTFDDVGGISIDIQDTLVEGTILSPKATVKNFGSGTESFNVTCEINPGGYSSTDTVTALASGDSVQVSFSPDFTFETGTYVVVVYTQLEGDENLANDTLKKLIVTYPEGIADGSSTAPISFSFGLRNNPTAEVLFNLALPWGGMTTLRIYDASGRLVDGLSGHRSAGYYQIPWEAKVNGVYFYTFETIGHKESGKLVIIH